MPQQWEKWHQNAFKVWLNMCKSLNHCILWILPLFPLLLLWCFWASAASVQKSEEQQRQNSQCEQPNDHKAAHHPWVQLQMIQEPVHPLVGWASGLLVLSQTAGGTDKPHKKSEWEIVSLTVLPGFYLLLQHTWGGPLIPLNKIQFL